MSNEQGPLSEGQHNGYTVKKYPPRQKTEGDTGWQSKGDTGWQSTRADHPLPDGVKLEDFHAYMPMHSYMFAPTREMWPATSVNSRVPPVPLFKRNGEPLLDDNGVQKMMVANKWLDRNQAVEQMTWAPGEPMLIRNRLTSDGGWVDRKGVTCFNLYRPPSIEHGDAGQAGKWIDHINRVYPTDADHIIQWLAQRVQKPQNKINHALVLGGKQGIGKDTLLEPVKRAIGPWNFSEVSPQHLIGRFNGFLRSVILRVSEARDLGDLNRYQFYDHMKSYTAAPPDVLRVDEKNLREYAILNCCGVIITTNHKADGIYLPSDDRRHYVCWSDLTKDDFTPEYWTNLWGFYEKGGDRHIAAYLATLDISKFDPKAPPPKTTAFWSIVDTNRAPEDAEFSDIIERLKCPAAITIDIIKKESNSIEFVEWIGNRASRRNVPHRMEEAGYIPVRNEAAKGDGLWKINGKRQVIYARSELSPRDQITAASKLMIRGGCLD